MKRVKDRVGLLLRVAVETDSKKSVFGAKLKVVNVFVVSGHGELWTPATCCCCCSYVLSCLLREFLQTGGYAKVSHQVSQS